LAGRRDRDYGEAAIFDPSLYSGELEYHYKDRRKIARAVSACEPDG
jgi:hypothetical protein